jgi:hypothetical protein
MHQSNFGPPSTLLLTFHITYLVMSNKWKIGQILVAFTEYLNLIIFTVFFTIENIENNLEQRCQCVTVAWSIIAHKSSTPFVPFSMGLLDDYHSNIS